jgi:hypothetical protein
MATVLTVWKRVGYFKIREPMAQILVLPTFRGELTIINHNGIDIREQKMLEA